MLQHVWLLTEQKNVYTRAPNNCMPLRYEHLHKLSHLKTKETHAK